MRSAVGLKPCPMQRDSSLEKEVQNETRIREEGGKGNPPYQNDRWGGGQVEVSFSSGKDSEVILELAKMAGVDYRAIYKNTTIDPPHTIAHCKSKGVEIMKPTITFFDLIKKKGFPTRRARFCCEKLKEYKIMDMAIQGIRREESTARAKRYSETDPVVCRNYGSKKNHCDIILPILS